MAAMAEGVVSSPEPIPLPHPDIIFGFLCAARLPAGCLPPPGRVPVRLGIGASFDRSEAYRAALYEGIERYSAQYRDTDGETMISTGLAGSAKATVPSMQVLLGHPANATEATALTSRGCAAHSTFPAAALNAVLELIEFDGVERCRDGTADCRPVALPDAIVPPEAAARIARAGRDLRLFRVDHETGVPTWLCLCRGEGGSRPVIASAAGLDPRPTIRRAVVEALLVWQNLEVIEARGTPIEELPSIHRDIGRMWFGEKPLPIGLGEALAESALSEEGGVGWDNDPDAALGALLRKWREDVALIDLTREEVAIPVVRAALVG